MCLFFFNVIKNFLSSKIYKSNKQLNNILHFMYVIRSLYLGEVFSLTNAPIVNRTGTGVDACMNINKSYLQILKLLGLFFQQFHQR